MDNQSQSQWVLERLVLGGLTRLHVGVTSVGRGVGCTITVSSDFVSRRHAEFIIQPESEEIEIQDLGSTNGVFINSNHYQGQMCKLQVGDRIGIGVSVDDNEVSADGKYPMYLLRRMPLNGDKNVAAEQSKVQDVIPPSPELRQLSPLESIEVADSDDEYDEDDDEDDFLQPEAIKKIKQDHIFASTSVVSTANTVSENIQSIFGDLNPDLLSNMPKELRAIAEASNKCASVASNDGVICISSDDEDHDDRVEKVKSPELFGDSFNNAEDSANAGKEKEVLVKEPSTSPRKEERVLLPEPSTSAAKEQVVLVSEPSTSAEEEEKVLTSAPLKKVEPVAPTATESIKLEPERKGTSIDEEEEFFLFFDELRDDSDNDPTHDYMVDDKGALVLPPIKQEKFSQNFAVDDVINVDGEEDDEFDEDFESKVNNWSFKLSSQSFSNSFNMSQVYEDDEDVDNAPVPDTEGIFLNISDDEHGEKAAVAGEGEKKVKESGLSTPFKEGKTADDISESPLIRHWKRSVNTKFLFSSSSSEDEAEPERPGTSSSTKDTIARQSSMAMDMTHKKPGLGRSSSEESEHKRTKDLKRQISSSSKSHTAERRDSENANAGQSPADIPRKKPRLGRSSSEESEHKRTKDLKRQISSSSKSHTAERRDSESANAKQSASVAELMIKIKKLESSMEKSKDSSTGPVEYRRTSSAQEEGGNKTYMSAEVQRRKSLGNQSSMEEMFIAEEIKQADPPHMPQPTKLIRGPPEIIAPPQLPTKKGKMRGVSAVQKSVADSLKAIQNKTDLKRKWKEKPSISRHKDKLKCQAIKEDRKQKLKEIADKKKAIEKTCARPTASASIYKNKNDVKKNLRVKCTEKNRGAFLAEDVSIKAYRIPKTNKKPESTSNESDPKPSSSSNTAKPASTSAKALKERQPSTEVVSSFDAELLRADEILQNSHKHSFRDRDHRKSTDTSRAEQKERAPARPKNKKLTFDAMEQHFEETKRLHAIQDKLAKASSMKSPESKPKKKKAVRFNDVPQIRYIERVSNANRSVYKKEPTTFNEREKSIRSRFPIIDQTDNLLTDTLVWSQLWLQNRIAGLNGDGVNEMIFPMTNQFTSIANYKSTILPLLKIEYLSNLERQMQKYASRSPHSAQIDYCTQYKNRLLVFAKHSASKPLGDLGSNDLALIEITASKQQFFGYIGAIRKGGSVNIISIEISQNVVSNEHQKNGTPITIRRILEGLRVYIGSFNAVHQLEQTPLFQKILNPLDLVNVKSQWKPCIQYKGCDVLNHEQREILLKTYAKSIDDYSGNISLIKGPPGTGKSRLISNLALQLLYGNEVRQLDKKILICAQNNMAVDVIAQQLHVMQRKVSSTVQKYQVIRFGKEEKVHKNVKAITVSKLIERDHKARLLERNGLAEHAIIGAQEILKLEEKIATWKKEKAQDVRQDKIIEMEKTLAIMKSVQNHTVHPEEERRLFPRYLENANIICTTLSSCIKLSHFINYFDVCIIDEATQCTEPWTIMPLRFGVSSLIMVGDPEQLPATVFSQKAKDYGLGLSLFARIQNCLESSESRDSSAILTLHTQYRMHPEICKWPNMYFYRNQLINSPNTSEFKSQIKPFSILNLEYRQNEDCVNGQIENSLEAQFVTKLVKILDSYIPNKFFSYGIITPYAQHREKLEVMIKGNGLQNIMVNTIDSYQGLEKDVIIISFARTRGIGFLSNYQRLNVALTRPKKCLILCGSFKNLESVPSWGSLLANAKERGLYHDISAVDALDFENNVIEKIKIKR